jgi:hypothetical protein
MVHWNSPAAGIRGILPAAAMFEPHSLLWNYLWVAPSVLLLILAVIFSRRSLYAELPFFPIFAAVQGVTVLALYVIDVVPSASSSLWWKANWVRLLIDVVVKFTLIGAIFSGVFKLYPAVSKLGRTMIRGVGAALVLAATMVAAWTRHTSRFEIVANAHLLELSDFMIEDGLLVFIFLFAAYFRLAWERLTLGIALGLGISASVHLGTWALLAIVDLPGRGRNLIDFLNMATFHACVLIWFYYALTTPEFATKALPGEAGARDHVESEEDERQRNLDVWNRELERLLHR